MTQLDAPDAAPIVGGGLDVAGWCLVAFAFLLPVAVWTTGYSAFLVPKTAVGLVALGPGLVMLGRLVVRGDRTARWAVAFLAAATLATLLADEPLMAAVGTYNWFNGLWFVALCVGVWALGRAARGRARRIETALLLGAGVNALWAWAASTGKIDYVLFGLFQGRPLGLMPNPVYLGALCVAGLWLAMGRERAAKPWSPWLLTVVLLIGAVELSGTRTAGAAALVAVVWCAVRYLRRSEPTRAAVLVAAVLLGFFLAQLPAKVDDTGTSRLSGDSSRGLSGRLSTWGDALDAVTDRPLFGFGPGRTMVAVSGRTPLAVAQTEGPQNYFTDAHNVFVEVLTTTGVIGFAAFLGWLVGAFRRSRGPLLGFVVLGGSVLLLEPTGPAFAPLLAFALGVAACDAVPAVDLGARGSPWVQFLSVGLAVLGAIAGFGLMLGDAQYLDAQREQSAAPLDVVDTVWPPWPKSPRFRAILDHNQADATHDSHGGVLALREARRALDRDRADPLSWEIVGQLEERWGSPARARRAHVETLRRLPWSP
ncbi:MAG: O-antigen ligase family protein, partial [Acidimicrobiia bacterium]